MSEEGDSEDFLGEEMVEETEGGGEDDAEPQAVANNPLTKEGAGESLSLLCRTGSGLAHAYVRMDLKGRGLTDISILRTYQHIRYMDISGNALEDISCIADLPHLLSINADRNRLTTAHLQELQYLQIASFAHNRIVSTDGVAHPLLHLLNLSNNKITELVGLDASKLPCLRVLDLHANRLTSINGINLPTLQKLYVASNKLTQCAGIQGLHQLTTLHMRENSVSSLDGFTSSLGALQYLNLRSNSIGDLSELYKLKCLPLLRALALTENPLCEMEDYRVEVCIILRKLERLDKEEMSEDERADAEEMQQQRQQATEESTTDDN